MTVTSVHKDPEALSMTFTAEFPAPVERVWQIWEDPRLLERWWGPPTWPATFDEHDVTVGGGSAYYMTGPEGEKARGWWRFTLVDAPNRLEFDDGFAGDDGKPLPEPAPVHCVVTLEATAEGTRMVTASTFSSAEHLEQMVNMGMEEGMREAMGQIDAILAAG
ncbi:SRPBCC domain-containing protein [Actinokineospora sp. PR83]|uniref:SRPBCC family protein n=1 Tax=Actinokineospora sp. PR83 TaxID=2884908 RepID=UPI0027E094F4|nr:SRPBCC domain-containing protein [Actinokineospora sp. PR83]MCG8915783.1 SRPBCC domain-containing protein [Actinokineospora sp. PR83]